jgi:glycosyltransferase involved in cell wall biosynthesis
LDKDRFEPLVVALSPGGSLEDKFKSIQEIQVLPLYRKNKFDYFYIFRILRLIRKRKVEVIQPFLTPATFFGLLPAILCRTPVKIITERSAYLKGGLGYRFYLKIEDFLSYFADWIVSNSEAGREAVCQRGIPRKKARVIYNGVNMERLKVDIARANEIRKRLNIPANGKVVGIMGSLTPVKDLATFLRAAAIINRSEPDARFIILGDGPLRPDLEQLSQELGIVSKTHFLGQQHDVANYLSLFDISVLTSQTEGCSNALIEAMALGKPVVATDVGGNRELIRQDDNGFLVPFGDAKAVAEAILSLLRTPSKTKEMGKRAKELAMNQFSLKKMIEQYQSLYEETLKKRL